MAFEKGIKGTTEWITGFLKGYGGQEGRFYQRANKVVALLCSQGSEGDGDAGHSEQAPAWLQLCTEPANTSPHQSRFLSARSALRIKVEQKVEESSCKNKIPSAFTSGMSRRCVLKNASQGGKTRW